MKHNNEISLWIDRTWTEWQKQGFVPLNSPEPEYPKEFMDVNLIIDSGAKKYAVNGWLEPNGKGTSHKEMYASIHRHVAEAYCGITKDKDSGLDPRLHAACRLLMDYTRSKRGIVNERD